MIGGPSAVAGPRSCRSRVPSPWMTRLFPAGRLAAAQPTHRDGRTADGVGISASQALTPSELRQILSLLPTSVSELDAKGGPFKSTPFASPFCGSAFVPGLRLQTPLYGIRAVRGTHRRP